MKKKIEKEETLLSYIKALDKVLTKPVYEPKDIEKLEIGKSQKSFSLAFRNFLNYLEDQFYRTEINGFSFGLWRKRLPLKNVEKRKKVFITTDDVVEANRLIKEKWKDEATELIFKLIVFSGIRLEHAHRLLLTFNPRDVIYEGKIAYYPIEDLTKGKKKGYFVFMPSEFAKKLKRFEKLLDYKTFKTRLQPERWKPPQDNPVSAVRIRSWFQNFAIDNGLKLEAVRFIVGHAPTTVGEEHYYNMLKIAKDEYVKLVDKFPIEP